MKEQESVPTAITQVNSGCMSDINTVFPSCSLSLFTLTLLRSKYCKMFCVIHSSIHTIARGRERAERMRESLCVDGLGGGLDLTALRRGGGLERDGGNVRCTEALELCAWISLRSFALSSASQGLTVRQFL